jgi:Rieske Fe-S protein
MPVSRRSFLRAAATLAGGVGIGVAVGDAAFGPGSSAAPNELVTSGRGQWYDVAAVDEVAVGTAKAFTAGGVLGYLVNDDGDLHAVSAICTHMGCRLIPEQGGAAAGPEFACLCHGSRFAASGRVLSGHARQPLPPIEVRVANGRVYALGTKETV